MCKKPVLICFFLVVIIGCKQRDNTAFYKIINENFLTFTDTAGYVHNSFFLIPNQTVTTSKGPTTRNVCLDESIAELGLLEKGLQNILESKGYSDYLKLFQTSYTEPLFIDLRKIQNTGKYNLLDSKQCGGLKPSERVGNITFFKPFIDDDFAIITIAKSSSPKAGVTTAFLLKKNEERWQVMHQLELERW